MTGKYGVIGSRQPKLDGPLKATGRSQFTDDVMLPGMLHGKIVRSTIPRGRIVNIDTSRAENHPGVKAVVTHKDSAGIRVGSDQQLLSSRVPDISTSILVFSSNINWGTMGFLLIKVDDDTRIC